MEQIKQQIPGGSSLVSCDGLPSYISAKFPWLKADDDNDVANQIFYALVHDDPASKYYEESSSCGIPEELLGRRIRGCFHGWLILSSNHPHYYDVLWFLWNPVTSEIIHLPPLNFKDQGDPTASSIGECCLSSPPDDDDNDAASVLLLTRTDKPTFVFCRLDHKTKQRLRWVEMSYVKQLNRMTSFDGNYILHSLTCCDGKVYALCNNGPFAKIVVEVDIYIKVKHDTEEVMIKLVLFGPCPLPSSFRCHSDSINFLKGSSTKLFYIIVGFHKLTKKIPAAVHLFRLDVTSIEWEEIEDHKLGCRNDMYSAGKKLMPEEELEPEEDLEDLDVSLDMWEEIQDLKDAIFFVDLTRDCPVFYNPVAKELGRAVGYIHIYGKTGEIIYSYHVKDNTISISSRVLLRLEEAVKCTVDSNQEANNEMIVIRSTSNDDEVIPADNQSRLLDLPFHVLEMIMELCVGVEYMSFRATCKYCHQVAPPIQWKRSNETTSRRLQTYSIVSPWLMVVDKNQGTITLTDPMLGDNYFIKNSHVSFDDDRQWCCRFGWLLFQSSNFECLVFFNPFTSDLQKLETDYFFKSLSFSAPPTSHDCIVVGFTTVWYWLVYIVAPEPTWRIFSICRDPQSGCVPTFYGRDLYVLSKDGEVIVLKDLGRGNYLSVEHLEAKVPTRNSARYFLTKCDQHPLLVILGEFGEAVEVFKFSKEWHKIDDLGRYTIYICGTSCLCIEAKVPHMENKIYFSWLHSKNKKIVFYSLETCAYHTFNGEIIQENFGDFLGTTHHLSPHVWIEPSWL